MEPEKQTVTCNRCGYEWTPRKGVTPKQCTRCKSPYWNKPRVQLLFRRPPAARVDGLPTVSKPEPAPLPDRLAAAMALLKSGKG